MKTFLIISLMLFASQLVFAQSSPLEKLSLTLEKSAIDFPKSKTFIKTDKDIYSPGEKVWFKAEVFNCLTEGPANENSLVLMIKAETGEVIVDAKYIITDGLVNNQITIPSWAHEGNAFLIAYTSKALTINEASLAAIKPITINQLKKNDYVLSVKTNKKIIKPGDEIKLLIKLETLSTSGKKEKIYISLFDYKKEIFKEKVSIAVNENVELKYKLPSNVDDGLYFVISTAGKSNVSKKIPVYTTNDNINVVFFAEGGELLSNNTQRIVYRAIDPFGKPANIAGHVYDELNNQVGIGKLLKDGIGLISLMPSPGQRYTLNVESDYGKGQKFELPLAVKSGSAFTLTKSEDSLIRVAINNIGDVIGEKLTVAAIVAGKVVLSYDFEAKEKNNFKIATANLPIGIINFVILDTKGQLISERLLYNIPNKDIDISIETKLAPTENNGEVEITIDMNNFIKQFGQCNVDVKIVDIQNLYKSSTNQQNTFLKYPLFTATPKTVLDIFMTNIELIANRYRYFNLQDILNGVNYVQSEQGKTLSGFVCDKGGTRIPNATVMIVHPNNLALKTTTSDENGNFAFTNLVKSDDMVVKAINESGKKTFEVHLNRSFDESLEELLLIESFNINQGYSIKSTPRYCEVNADLLSSIGSENKSKKPKQPSNAEGMLQSGSSLFDVIKMIKPFSILDNQIVFYGSTNSLLNQQGALIVIDGQKMGTSIDALNYVSPYDVVSVNISTNPADIQKYTGLNSVGVIEIKTRGKLYVDEWSENEDPEGKQAQYFDQSDFPKNVWRYQTTLDWQPNLPVNENGIIKMKLKVSELETDFVIQVDATSFEGITHQQSTTFSTIKK